jgi:hypothetical protein
MKRSPRAYRLSLNTDFTFNKFPKTEPFEREVAVNFSI